MNSRKSVITAGMVLAVIVMLAAAAPVVTLAAGTPTSTTASKAAVAATPTPAPTPITVMTGTVKGKTGNVRAGPGTGYQVVATVKSGDKLNLTGRTSDSAWLQVCCTKNAPAWISASLVTPSGKVASLPVVKEIPKAAAAAKPAAKPASRPTAAKPPQPAAQPTEPALDPNLGCYLIQNQIGAELTVTITARDWHWIDTFKLGPMAERVYCLGPGSYTYTLDCPPPWADLNGELTVQAGDRYLWPVRGEAH